MSQTDQQKLHGIFSLKCFNGGNQVKINHLENVMLKNNEYIADTKIKDFNIIDEVIGEIYNCNMTDTYLMSTKKLPVLYLNVAHKKTIQNFLLYKVYLYFTITSEIKSVHDLLDEKVSGKYVMEILIDNKKKELDDTTISEKYPGDDKIYAKLENFAKSDLMKDLTINLISEINDRLSLEYGKELDHFMNKPEKFISSKKDNE